jgi:hypothetical protein
MSIFDKAKAAREHADRCIDPSCHALACALEAALTAAAHEQLSELEPEEPSLEGIPDPPVSHAAIPRPASNN